MVVKSVINVYFLRKMFGELKNSSKHTFSPPNLCAYYTYFQPFHKTIFSCFVQFVMSVYSEFIHSCAFSPYSWKWIYPVLISNELK